MAKSSPMHVLRNLAEQTLNDTTQELGKMRQLHANAAAQLEQLTRYEQEYSRQLQDAMSATGMPVVNLLSHQFFISSLSRVAKQHASHVEECQKSVDRALDSWKKDKQRLNAFETLISRADAVLQLKESRQEQKMMDEFAQRASLRSAGL
ncbi:flagellar export protein FliJ [Mixta tenebrionis]|uniref:Flagellar FliJ protein n=1 Tax=Mixta tenebrionis TaxID=2562439 RepID=A0A506V517_9GAMM|nr:MULTISPECIES: flagellar export protein FliJ [Mixta]QHM77474.1 Flagellar FliJ protein [Mixta theicola]TPW40646.1 flagella biosynthesis chaperone FliJ [Mixta tenebrionis]